MDKRIYNDSKKSKIIKKSTYRGNKYFVVSMNGYYPTAYVETEKELDYDEVNGKVAVYGGFTFSGKLNMKGMINKIVIGWDYAHGGDFASFFPEIGGNVYTVAEIENECKKCIDQLIDKGFIEEKTMNNEMELKGKKTIEILNDFRVDILNEEDFKKRGKIKSNLPIEHRAMQI